ncbi:hypothetical protein PoB_001866600 [Plakobranchus ocellatus]|uniref:Uncharacterized protein n=1 Tax=Plakobranchus ocellatus TaxID=259542 RepID=A0AAV3Z8E2_9GAST|nr:hypothetical protein PoB_001866600 [Plakobranchus ocellatus]
MVKMKKNVGVSELNKIRLFKSSPRSQSFVRHILKLKKKDELTSRHIPIAYLVCGTHTIALDVGGICDKKYELHILKAILIEGKPKNGLSVFITIWATKGGGVGVLVQLPDYVLSSLEGAKSQMEQYQENNVDAPTLTTHIRPAARWPFWRCVLALRRDGR